MMERCAGRVKWFNKKGFGFITACNGDREGEDVFVHHSSIVVEGELYKYLVQGEYVEFSWSKTSSGEHEWHATQVRGINNWQLMCETLEKNRVSSIGEELHGHTSPMRDKRTCVYGGRDGKDQLNTLKRRVQNLERQKR